MEASLDYQETVVINEQVLHQALQDTGSNLMSVNLDCAPELKINGQSVILTCVFGEKRKMPLADVNI